MATDAPIESVPQVSIEHIIVDNKGVARIAGSRSKVSQIVIDHRRLSPDEIVEQYQHLTLSDVHAALAYYYDHRADIDKRIEEDERLAEEQRRQQINDPDYNKRVENMKARWTVLQAKESLLSRASENI